MVEAKVCSEFDARAHRADDLENAASGLREVFGVGPDTIKVAKAGDRIFFRFSRQADGSDVLFDSNVSSDRVISGCREYGLRNCSEGESLSDGSIAAGATYSMSDYMQGARR